MKTIAELKIESVKKVKNNHFYGDYEIKETNVRTIINEKYEGLVSPAKGIVITFKTIDGDKVTFTIDRHYYTGLKPCEIDKGTTFDTSFSYGGHIYEVSVNEEGGLEYLYEWYSIGGFEDGNDADNVYTGKSKGVKWELIDK